VLIDNAQQKEAQNRAIKSLGAKGSNYASGKLMKM
jgi:hypothetical protein